MSRTCAKVTRRQVCRWWQSGHKKLQTCMTSNDVRHTHSMVPEVVPRTTTINYLYTEIHLPVNQLIQLTSSLSRVLWHWLLTGGSKQVQGQAKHLRPEVKDQVTIIYIYCHLKRLDIKECLPQSKCLSHDMWHPPARAKRKDLFSLLSLARTNYLLLMHRCFS